MTHVRLITFFRSLDLSCWRDHRKSQKSSVSWPLESSSSTSGSGLRAKLLQSCPTLCNPVDCSPPGSSVHGILQARILEWVAVPFSRGPSWPRDWTCISYISYIDRRFFLTGLCPSNPVVINLACTFKSPLEYLDTPAQIEPQNNYIRLSGGGTHLGWLWPVVA